MSRADNRQRNIEIARAVQRGSTLSAAGERFGLSRAAVSRAARAGAQLLSAAPVTETVTRPARSEAFAVRGPEFEELGRTGLRRFGGRVDEEYDRSLSSLRKRAALYKTMADDPICAAILNAVRLPLRRVAWYVEPGGSTPADEAAAEFLDGCMHDMSQSWTDTIDQALGMIQYGFQPAELVYKQRLGRDGEPGSLYDDGLIGWRKWVFLAQDSLAPGNEWVFDDEGGLQAINQQAPPDYKAVTIPIDKCILFRTTAERGNPEGKSLLRGMYTAYYYKKNTEEIEAISAERMGTGFPVIYAGKDVNRDSTQPNSDAAVLKDILANIRVDDQMGLFLPWAKMGAGAKEGEGVLFEFTSPPSKGVADMNQMITRYEQRMAMVGLGQFIMLGMSKVGTQALAREDVDFFTLAVTAWADSIEDTINRYAVSRLLALNDLGQLTDIPRIRHAPVAKQPLGQLADYVNKLAGAALITPGPELEDYLREAAELPEKPDADESAPTQPALQEHDGEDQSAGELAAADQEIVAALRAAVEALNASEQAEQMAAAPGGPVEYNINLAAPAEQPIVNVAAPNVNVQPADVHVAAPAVNVQPAAVTVNTPAVSVRNSVDTAPLAAALAPMTGALAGLQTGLERIGQALRLLPAPQVNVKFPRRQVESQKVERGPDGRITGSTTEIRNLDGQE